MFGGQSSTNLKRPQSVYNPTSSSVRDGVQNEPHLDQDQEKKYQEIIDLLVAGGYFRARIQGLSRFDKVVGGMAWCITASNEDLDVDLFFQEEANMGQRIKLGEQIIRGLQRMKCPFRLESYQIQGGGSNNTDFVNIFPIIQWLVKKVIETREETGDLMRLFSESQFDKNFQLPEDKAFEEQIGISSAFMRKVNDRYKPSRKFKRPGRRVPYLNPRSLEENVQSTLLEYGAHFATIQKTEREKSDSVKQLEESLGKGKKKELSAEEEEAEKKRNELRKELTSFVSSERVQNVGNLFSGNIDEIASEYEDSEEGLSPAEQASRYAQRMHASNLHKLEKETAQQKSEVVNSKQKLEETEKKNEELQTLYNKKVAYNNRIIQETQKLDALETPENTKQLQMLRSLVSLNENLKNQENLFKANCKKQRTELQAQIDKLKQEVSSGKNPEAEAVDKSFTEDVDKLKKFKALLAKKNRDLALLDRKIDEIPSSNERSQYQRQFVELYDTIASKETETRQYFTSFNTLEDTKKFLQKELSILNSIRENYKTAMSSKNSQQQLLTSIGDIVKSVGQNLEKIEQRYNSEKDKKSKLNDQYTALVEKERAYFKATKDLHEESKRYEMLRTKLSEISS